MRPLVKYHRRDVGGDKKSPRAFSPAFSRENARENARGDSHEWGRCFTQCYLPLLFFLHILLFFST